MRQPMGGMPMSISTRGATWAASMVLAAAILAGCGGGSGGGSPEGPPATAENALTQFADCDELRAAIVDDARAKITLQAQALREHGFVANRPVPTFPAPVPSPSPAAEGPTAGGPRDFTDTNTQVPDVDEADVVETDGTHLY